MHGIRSDGHGHRWGDREPGTMARLGTRLRDWFQDQPEERQGGLLASGAVLLLALALWRMGAVLTDPDGGASIAEALFWCFAVIPLTLAAAVPVVHYLGLLAESRLTPEREERLEEWLRRHLGRLLGE